ncbi:hypothetical protein D3C85_1786410 [compost metagenome]
MGRLVRGDLHLVRQLYEIVSRQLILHLAKQWTDFCSYHYHYSDWYRYDSGIRGCGCEVQRTQNIADQLFYTCRTIDYGCLSAVAVHLQR